MVVLLAIVSFFINSLFLCLCLFYVYVLFYIIDTDTGILDTNDIFAAFGSNYSCFRVITHATVGTYDTSDNNNGLLCFR